MSATTSDALVLFGASGDLARKMTFPSLYRLAARGALDVPVIAYGVDGTLTNGRLADVAPTLLDMMGLSQPAAMSGHSLLVKGA